MPGRVRYFQDTSGGKIIGGLAWTQLAAALNQVGEPGRARLAFGIARQRLDQRDPTDYYGSGLRDRAALLALAQEAAGRDGLLAVANAVRERMVAQGRVHDHAGAGVAGARGQARCRGGGELAYSVDGAAQKAASEPVVINPDAAAIARGVRVKNEGERPVWLQVTARGVPQRSAARGRSRPRGRAQLLIRSTASRPISPRCARTIGWSSRSTASTPAAAITRWRCSTCCRPASRSSRW